MSLAVHDDIIKEYHASLVTINQHPLALIVLASHAHAVGIRVRSHHYVSIDALSQIKCHCKSLAIFGVRTLHCGEIAILHHLLGHAMHILKSPKLQRIRNKHHARTMQRRIHNLQVLLTLDSLGVNAQCVYLVKINLVNILANNLDECRIALKLDILNLHLVHLCNDALIVWSKHLCAIVPISLVAIILLRIVAGGQNDTALTTKVAYGKRHFGGWTHVLKQIHLDAIC